MPISHFCVLKWIYFYAPKKYAVFLTLQFFFVNFFITFFVIYAHISPLAAS